MVYRSFISALRKWGKTYLEFVFPPFCLFCSEMCSTRIFCPFCWELSAPPDPAERCRHCFEEKEEKGTLCATCKKEPFLPVSRAYVLDAGAPLLRLKEFETWASFAVLQWIQLEWPMPDAIVPMPDKESITFAKYFSQFLNRPLVKALKANLEWREDTLNENQELLILDVFNLPENLKKGVYALTESFPKRMFVLSLSYDDPRYIY